MRPSIIVVVIAACLLAGVPAAGADCSVEAFFTSPASHGGIQQKLLLALESAAQSVYVAMYAFTDDALGAALVRVAGRGVEVRVILDSDQVDHEGSELPTLQNGGIQVGVDNKPGLMHDKFLVVDSSLVVTGSYNWSDAANTDNFENVVFIECPEIAAAYVEAFRQIAIEAGIPWYSPASTPSSTVCTAPYVASKNSEIFHKAECSYVQSILDANRVCYGTRDEAIASGRRPCSKCNP